MRGKHAFCPSSGALLADERERPQEYRPGASPVRAPEPDEINEILIEPYSRGANHSSASALVGYFRRMRKRHAPEADPTIARQAALAIQRLKEPEDDVHDDYLWYALAERLHRHDDYTQDALDWLWQCVELSCPHCFGPITDEPVIVEDAVHSKCAINCTDDNRYVDDEIRERMLEAYNEAFRRADGRRDIEALLVLDEDDE
ncbi:hypothetical protein [Halococcus sp. PRR34]|uniref:hypothetical protein n=1 Tax=Halococcus sp. PRR34 TaxID=3020830 RepID=UPI0023610BB8|nr:hypothetical protein [Halococcus sp. PRR34]